MAWRKSWTFGSPVRDILGISPSDSNESVVAKFASWLTSKVEDVDLSPNFLTLKHEAYSGADPHNADRGGCAGAYDAGHYDTKVTWTKLKWLNKELLQIDASDTSFATTVSGSGSFQGSGATVASAVDCADWLILKNHLAPKNI